MKAIFYFSFYFTPCTEYTKTSSLYAWWRLEGREEEEEVVRKRFETFDLILFIVRLLDKIESHKHIFIILSFKAKFQT